MDKSALMVDGDLGAVRLARIRKIRDRLRTKKSVAARPGAGPVKPLLTGNQKLEPGRVYPSTRGLKTQFYLPEYRLADESGNAAVELRFGGDADSGGDGEVGRLTIDLSWKPPRGRGRITPSAMDHETELELRYRIPVEGSSSSGTVEVVALQPLQPNGDSAAQSVTTFTDRVQFDAVYQAMRDAERQATLHLSHVADVGVRTWRQVRVGTAADRIKQVSALERRNALMTNVLGRETLSQLGRGTIRSPTARVTVRRDRGEEARRVRDARAALSRPATARRPGRTIAEPGVRVRGNQLTTAQIRKLQAARARRAGRRKAGKATRGTARGNPAGRSGVRVRANPVVGRRMSASRIRRSSATPRVRAVTARKAVAGRKRTVRAGVPKKTASVRVNPRRGAVVAAPTTRARLSSAQALRTKSVLSASTLSRVNAPALSKAIASSDLRFKDRKVVPLQLALNRKGKPAVVDAQLDCSAELPFFFDPRTQSSVYATGSFQTGGIHLLLPRTLTDESGRTNRVVYQDNLMPDVIHVAPTEYRLARSQDAPFLPGLSMLCADFGTTTDGDQQAEVMFNVVCSYELEPWLDPEIVELARAELAAEGLTARFTPIVPREASLTLELDLLGDGKQRAEAEIETSVGIADTLILDHDAFTRLWREHLANETGGVTGAVEYELFDGTPARSRVDLSLWETSPDVFDVDFLGMLEDQPGLCRVRIRNRIESPVEIVGLPSERLSADAAAVPTNGAALAGRLLAPQESVEVDYQINPPDAVVESVDPVIFGRVRPDLNALLKLFVLNSGYSSMSFSVDVRAAEGVFSPPAEGAEPLTGLLVEFDDGSNSQLSPDEPETEVTLVGRLIDQLTGNAGEQQRYFYRVTNLHPSGEGARTAWKEGQGTDPIEVGTAVVQLDF